MLGLLVETPFIRSGEREGAISTLVQLQIEMDRVEMSFKLPTLVEIHPTALTCESFDSAVDAFDVTLQVSFGRVLTIAEMTVVTTEECD